jgi:rhodanese-related sulfurtransferase
MERKMAEEEFVLPEITPQELADWLKTRPELQVLDVREPYEFPRAKLNDERVAYAPLSDLARKQLEGLPEKVKADKAAPLVVICHHGNRSAQVTAWLLDLGWESVYNLAGGIDAYARLVDPQVGRY